MHRLIVPDLNIFEIFNRIIGDVSEKTAIDELRYNFIRNEGVFKIPVAISFTEPSGKRSSACESLTWNDAMGSKQINDKLFS
jgi:hypothetical protein